MKYMREYVKSLLARFARPHLNARKTEVHVVFDNLRSMPESPKEIEQARRDAHSLTLSLSLSPSEHTCFVMHHSKQVEKYLRKCNRNLTSYVASAMLELVPQFLATGQEFITNICEMAYTVLVHVGKQNL